MTAFLIWCASARSQAVEPIQVPSAADYDMSSLVDSLRTLATNVHNPGRSEVARYMNNAIRIAEFRRVFKEGKKVDGYLVVDREDFVAGIYPFPPAILSDELRVVKNAFTGTGEWYVSQTVLAKREPNNLDAMENFDKFIRNKAHQQVSEYRLRALSTMVSDLSSGQIEVGFSDVTGQLYLGEPRQYGIYGAIPGLEGLGESLMSASDPKDAEGLLMSFVNSERYYELHGGFATETTKAERKAAKRRRKREHQELVANQARARAAWLYVKSAIGLACSNPRALAAQAAQGNVVQARLRYIDLEANRAEDFSK